MLLLTRPQAASEGMQQELAAKGIETEIVPLLDIRPKKEAIVALEGVARGAQALLMTSANALCVLERMSNKAMPLYCVGAHSMKRAQEVGFAKAHYAGPNVQELVNTVSDILSPDKGVLVYVSSEDVSKDLNALLPEFDIRRIMAYHAATINTLPDDAVIAFENQRYTGVVLYSTRTAEHFVRLMKQYELTDKLGELTAYCLSEAIAEELKPLALGNVVVAKEPCQDAFLELFDSVA